MMVKWIHQLLFESPLFQTQWQNISLLDIAEQKKIDPNTVMASDFYEAFYDQFDESGYNFDIDWIRIKQAQTDKMRNFINKKLSDNCNARFLSIGVGTGFIEETLLNEGFKIDLQECQPVSLNYLRKKKVPFKEYITSDLSILPQEEYDVIFAFTISYCFGYDDYQAFLKSIYALLKKGGQLILFDPNINRPRRPLIKYVLYPVERVKQWLREYRSTSSYTKGVFWGWLRHSYLHRVLAKRAGFYLKSEFFTDNYSQKVSDLYQAVWVWFVYQK